MSSEAAIQAAVRVLASQAGWRLWRNNVGQCQMPDGSYVRYGLANDSKQLNAALKSGDLIGIRPRLILPTDVGTLIGQFVSRECKPTGWHLRKGDARGQAQQAWIDLINTLGGDAGFTTGQL